MEFQNEKTNYLNQLRQLKIHKFDQFFDWWIQLLDQALVSHLHHLKVKHSKDLCKESSFSAADGELEVQLNLIVRVDLKSSSKTISKSKLQSSPYLITF